MTGGFGSLLGGHSYPSAFNSDGYVKVRMLRCASSFVIAAYTGTPHSLRIRAPCLRPLKIRDTTPGMEEVGPRRKQRSKPNKRQKGNGMTDVKNIDGDLTARGTRHPASPWRAFSSFISERLLEGALDAHTSRRRRRGYRSSSRTGRIRDAAGAQAMAESKKIRRAHRPRLRHPWRDAALRIRRRRVQPRRGSISMQYNLPIGFGVLTVDTIEQAIERAGARLVTRARTRRLPSSRW